MIGAIKISRCTHGVGWMMIIDSAKSHPAFRTILSRTKACALKIQIFIWAAKFPWEGLCPTATPPSNALLALEVNLSNVFELQICQLLPFPLFLGRMLDLCLSMKDS
jgi:hypothetical protein